MTNYFSYGLPRLTGAIGGGVVGIGRTSRVGTCRYCCCCRRLLLVLDDDCICVLLSRLRFHHLFRLGSEHLGGWLLLRAWLIWRFGGNDH